MIIGLSLSHNCTACVVDATTGAVIFCSSEERFTRRKNDWGFPERTLRHILSHVVAPEAVTGVAVGELCQARWGAPAFAELVYLHGYDAKDQAIRNKLGLPALVAWEMVCRLFGARSDYRGLIEGRLRSLGVTAPVRYFDHHAAHAASAFYCSQFEDALVVTLDGEGDRKAGSCWQGNGTTLERIGEVPEIASAGKFYRAVTSMLGFKVNRHEGKITGLAAYGNPERFAPVFRRYLRVEDDGASGPRLVSEIASRYMRTFGLRNVNPVRLARYALLFLKARTWEGLLNDMLCRYFRETYAGVLGLDFDCLRFEDMADVAAAAQQVLEEAVTDFVGALRKRHPSPRLALAGGVFANVKLNQRLLEDLPTEEIYIHPGMGDEGLAIGAAMLAFHEGRKARASATRLDHVYLGLGYDGASIEAALQAAGLTWRRLETEELVEEVAEALVREKVVGLYRGAWEYGPRALGHRTILVNPAKREINDVVNKRLRRTEFMPFAPVVTAEHFDEIFTGSKRNGARFACRFMTITLDVNPEYQDRIRGVVHVDGTVRPQVIGDGDDPVYLGILRRFHEKTGIGCVVNTSFNAHEEPIVGSPEDAVRSFMDGCVDMLVMENYFVAGKKPS